MADVKWIKIVTDVFDDEKVLLIESMPDADSIIVMWFKILCLAGKQNRDGFLMLNDKIAYTDEMLATVFRRPVNTVRLALQTFEQFGMIEVIDGTICISNWERHQNIEGMEKIREQNRLAQQRSRAKKKLLQASNSVSRDSHVTVTQCHATEGEEDKEKDIEEDIKEIHKEKIDYQQIVDMFNSICVSLPSVRSLSEARKKAIKARLTTYTVDDFRRCFENAEASSFLKGGNNRNWVATFDWLIKDTNMAKVLDGNFADRESKGSFGNSSFDTKDFFEAAVARSWEEKEPPTTAADDDSILQKAKSLKERLG